ncbi:hypothetical protein E3N88_11195 [Mikania micrantha]|uniref:RING-type E3 ubiquitin transferase n=1 Tax=Mikania micrantha TaxID=192012 RepID=A0A5N6PER1_9ASTR|nr:hypothetical protein E3N88_11195 [Mikania micrantha]
MVYRRLQQTDIAIPPSVTNGSSTDGGYTTGDDSFDNNMMIILAVLLCALICALGLNSIVRCFFRCGRTIFLGNTRHNEAGTGQNVRTKGKLSEIPVVVYRSEMKIPATDCPICLGDFSEENAEMSSDFDDGGMGGGDDNDNGARLVVAMTVIFTMAMVVIVEGGRYHFG